MRPKATGAVRANASKRRNVCFITGTRAEYGLMRKVLGAIAGHPKLKLQLLATGMHLDPVHGDGLGSIQNDGRRIDRVIAWTANSGASRSTTARNTGIAMSAMADAFHDLRTDLVLVVGDRVEAFAAASAGQLSGVPVAHVHGGDRAAGQVDDALRHAISKLAHIHFPATDRSAERLRKLGEDRWRIHRAGSPGIDGIADDCAPLDEVAAAVGELNPKRYALLILHPVDADEKSEARRARLVLDSLASVGFERIVAVYPNNDPGGRGIIRALGAFDDDRMVIRRDVPRPVFLSLMRDAAVLVGNSSSGIIEAASFGTPVIDIGPRQHGRERGRNVVHVPYDGYRIRAALRRIWNGGRPRRFTSENIYGGGGIAARIASVLASIQINDRLLRKVISY